MRPICSAVSGLPLPSGGMASSSTRRATDLTSALSALLPATKALPFSPPLVAKARVSRRSLPFCFLSPWHSKQFFSKMGLMSLSNVRPAFLEAGEFLLGGGGGGEREREARAETECDGKSFHNLYAVGSGCLAGGQTVCTRKDFRGGFCFPSSCSADTNAREGLQDGHRSLRGKHPVWWPSCRTIT